MFTPVNFYDKSKWQVTVGPRAKGNLPLPAGRGFDAGETMKKGKRAIKPGDAGKGSCFGSRLRSGSPVTLGN